MLTDDGNEFGISANAIALGDHRDAIFHDTPI